MFGQCLPLPMLMPMLFLFLLLVDDVSKVRHSLKDVQDNKHATGTNRANHTGSYLSRFLLRANGGYSESCSWNKSEEVGIFSQISSVV